MSYPQSSPVTACINSPGIYFATFTNLINGCTSTNAVTVTANSSVPSISVTPITSNGFTINCTDPKVIMTTSTSGTLAPIGYTWTPLATPFASVTPATGNYTTTVPGLYEAALHDGNFCTVTTTIYVSIDTLRPSPYAITNLSSNSFTINCNTSSLTATAMTNPVLPASNYSWTAPPNLVISSNTVSITYINITSSTTPTTYTALAMGTNGCIGRAPVKFYKDIYVPPYSAVFSPSAISCATPTIAMNPNNISGTTTPVSFTFTSPPPTTYSTSAPATFSVAGTYTMTYMNTLNGCISTTMTTVPLVSPCGVNEMHLNENLLLYPNPNNGTFIVEYQGGKNTELYLINAIGQVVYRKTIVEGKNSLRAEGLTGGIYFYKIIEDKAPVKTGKLIIE